MPHKRLVAFILVSAAALAVAACGGGSPTSPSAEGVVVRGTVLGAGAAGASSLSAGRAAAALTVFVQENPAITATVAADGTFTLRGLPEGGFTLVFTSGGMTLGSLSFAEVQPNQEITITVRVDGSAITLVDQQRNGIGHGDVEIEGTVSAVLALPPAGDSRFMIDGKTVVARPGQTAIREGNKSRAVSDLALGTHVHVKGVWMTDASGQVVLAQEIMIQGSDDVVQNPPAKSCMIEGGTVGAGIELEGSVVGGGGAAFLMRVQGNRSSGNVQVDASGASFKCNGPKTTPAECLASVKSGAKVHVSGTLVSCDVGSAVAQARQVMVQK